MNQNHYSNPEKDLVYADLYKQIVSIYHLNKRHYNNSRIVLALCNQGITGT